MISFHDVIKTYRWEVRFLSFVFGIAEANAFSCYKIWGNNGNELFHAEFKSRLGLSMLEKVKAMKSLAETAEATPVRTRACNYHEYVDLGLSSRRIRRKCEFCESLRGKKKNQKQRTQKRCKCQRKSMCKECHHEHCVQNELQKRTS